GTGWKSFGSSGTGGGPSMVVVERYASGTSPSGSTANVWTGRVLNTVVVNDISGAALNSDQVSLPAGSYYVEWSAPTAYYSTGGLFSHTRLRNMTDDATLASGTACTTDNWAPNVCHGVAEFTLSDMKGVSIQHWVNKTRTEGFGSATSSGEPQVFTILKIWKR
ncbi:MAG TPA: hypothetical protein PL182_09865, partial [Pseudobdellovibrionaceae bacterium]|nr:hypothetical protein [Pseudobdellovibrionaceae bacterium]